MTKFCEVLEFHMYRCLFFILQCIDDQNKILKLKQERTSYGGKKFKSFAKRITIFIIHTNNQQFY